MITNIKAVLVNDEGATMVEYGLLVGLIAAISIALVKSIGLKISNSFSTVNKDLP